MPERGGGKERERDRVVMPPVLTWSGVHHELSYSSGLFEPEFMTYDTDRDPTRDPSLAEMTEVAVQMLSRNPQGFYLFVEGGRLCLADGGGDRGPAQAKASLHHWIPQGAASTMATMNL